MRRTAISSLPPLRCVPVLVALGACTLHMTAFSTPATAHGDRHVDEDRWRSDWAADHVRLRNERRRDLVFRVSVPERFADQLRVVSRRGQARSSVRTRVVRPGETVEVPVTVTGKVARRDYDGIVKGRVRVEVFDACDTDRRFNRYERSVVVRATGRDGGSCGRPSDHAHDDHHDQPWAGPGKPNGYQTLAGSRATRLADIGGPLLVAPGARGIRHATADAVDAWNRAARSAGLPAPFALARGAREADLVLDWSGRGLPRDRDGATRFEKRGRHWTVESVVLDPDLLDRRPERVARAIAHELGHVLGLGHSNARSDLMFRGHDGRGRDDVRASRRDVDMLSWLYRQRPDVVVRVDGAHVGDVGHHDDWRDRRTLRLGRLFESVFASQR